MAARVTISTTPNATSPVRNSNNGNSGRHMLAPFDGVSVPLRHRRLGKEDIRSSLEEDGLIHNQYFSGGEKGERKTNSSHEKEDPANDSKNRGRSYHGENHHHHRCNNHEEQSSSSSSNKNGGFRRLKKFTKSPTAATQPTSFACSSPAGREELSDSKSTSTCYTPSRANTKSSTSLVENLQLKPSPKAPQLTKQTKKGEDLSASEKFQQAQLRLWKAAQERHRKMQQLQEEKRLKKKHKREQQQVNTECEEDAASPADGAEKKSKQGKKLQVWKENDGLADLRVLPTAPAASIGSTNATATSHDSATTSQKKKNKRRLVMMDRPQKEENKNGIGATPPKKKKVKLEELGVPSPETPHPQEHRDKSTPDESSYAAEKSICSTPTLSLGLADTVKTRVRSCTKSNKDKELELLQAASFEKKKRKKHRNSDRASCSDSSRPTTPKKSKMKLDGDGNFVQRKKAEKKKVEYIMDANGHQVAIKRKRGRPPKNRAATEATAYDADAEVIAAAGPIIQGKRGRPNKKKHSVGSMPTILPSETFLTTTMPMQNTIDIAAAADKKQKEHHALPFKKRVAAVDAFWEKRPSCGGTTISKVSISSGSGAARELETSSISEFTHPTLEHNNTQHPMTNAILSSVPPEIFSKRASTPAISSFDLSIGNPANVIGPTISSDSSDESSDSDTDEEELYEWANKMFGTNAIPNPKKEAYKKEPAMLRDMPPEMCEMERRRLRQEEARALTAKEIRAFLKEEVAINDPMQGNWVRRSVRQPSRSLLNTSLVRKLLDKLRGNDFDMVVLKMKKYLSDPDTPPMAIDAALEALEECTICEALYIQNFNKGMRDKQVLHLLRILQMPQCNIWCLNIGETYNVSDETWEIFADGLKKTKITHMYASEHTITTELKEQIRETIRLNRRKHNMHNDPNNLDVIVQCTHCWWNPINAKVLRPYIRKRGLETLLHDKEAQGLRGSMSAAPGGSPTR